MLYTLRLKQAFMTEISNQMKTNEEIKKIEEKLAKVRREANY